MSGGGSSKSTQTVQQKADPWSGVQPYLTSLYSQASGLPAQSFYPYQTYAGQSPLTGAGQTAGLNFAGNALPGYIQSGNAGLQSMLGAANVASNPYVNQMLQQQIGGMTNAFSQNADTITRQLREQWLPSIRSGSSLAGQYGGTRQGVAEGVGIGEAARALENYASNAQNALGQSIAQTQLGAYGQGLDSQARAMAFLPQMAQLGMMPSQMLGQYGGQEEGYRQKAIDDAVARYNFAQQAPYNQLAFRNSIYSGVPWNSTQTTSGNTGSSTAANVLGGALTGASLAGPLAAMGGPITNGIAALGSPFAGALGFGGAFALPLAIGGGLLGGLFG